MEKKNFNPPSIFNFPRPPGFYKPLTSNQPAFLILNGHPENQRVSSWNGAFCQPKKMYGISNTTELVCV